MSVLKRILDESKARGVQTPEEGANLYDQGVPKIEESPEVSVNTIPQQNIAEPPTQTSTQDDNRYGFVYSPILENNQDQFDTTGSTIATYDDVVTPAMDYYMEERKTGLPFMDLPQEASEGAKTAAFNSDINYVDYTAGGEFLRSFTAGVGQVFNSFADTMDWLSGTDSVTNQASPELANEDVNLNAQNLNYLNNVVGADTSFNVAEAFRAVGDALESVDDNINMSGIDGQFTRLDENGNLKISFAQMANPKFWYTKVAQQIPNLLTFMVGGAAVGKLAVKGAKAIGVADKVAFKGPSLLKSIGTGLGSKAMGKLPNTVIKGKDIAGFIGGGAGANMLEGAMIAGEAHRQVLEKGGTIDQAASAAYGVFEDNLKWMAIDALQYNILTKGLKGIGAAVKLNSGINFKTAIARFALGSGVAVSEGILEQFQEVHQDWSTKKNTAEVLGEEFDTGFFEYFNDPAVAETRVVAFSLGILGAGAGIVNQGVREMAISTIDSIAERSRIIDNKIKRTGFSEEYDENLLFAQATKEINEKGYSKDQFTKAEAVAQKVEEIRERFLAGIVAAGEIELGNMHIDRLVKEQKLTQEEGDSFKQKMNEIQEAFNKYDNVGMSRLTFEAKKEMAYLAYYQSKNDEIIQQNKDYYQAQREKVEANTKMSDRVRKQNLEDIAAEEKQTIEILEETSKGYQQSMDNLYDESRILAKKQQEERKDIIKQRLAEQKEKQEQESPTQITEQEVKQEKKEEVEKIKSEIEKLRKRVVENQTTKSKQSNQRKIFRLLEQKYIAQGLSKENAKKTVKEVRSILDSNLKFTLSKEGQQEIETGQMDDVKIEMKKGKRFFALEKALTEKFRKKNVNIVIGDFSNTRFSKEINQSFDNVRLNGVAMGLSVYLDLNTATRETLKHEFSHIYMSVHWTSKPMTALKKIVLKSNFYKEAQRNYYDQLIFEKDNVKYRLSNIINQQEIQGYLEWRKKTKKADKSVDGYLASQRGKLSKLGYRKLRAPEQRFVLEEAVAKVLEAPLSDSQIKKAFTTQDSPTAKRKIDGFFSYVSSVFTRQDSKQILEAANIEGLVTELKDAVGKVDIDMKKVKSFTKRVRRQKGYGNKMQSRYIMNTRQTAKNAIKTEINNLIYSEAFKETREAKDSFNPTGKRKGMPTAKYIQALQNLITQNSEQMQENVQQYGEEVSNYLFDNNGKPRKDFFELVNEEFQSYRTSPIVKMDSEFESFTENDENYVEAFLETRNGEGRMGEFMSDFVKKQISIGGVDINLRHLRQVLYNSVKDDDGVMLTKEQYVERHETMLEVLKEGETFTSKNQLLANFMNYMKEVYKGDNTMQGNPIEHIYQELSSFKQIDFHTISFVNGKYQIKKSTKIENNIVKKRARESFINSFKVKDNKQTDEGFTDSMVSRLNLVSNLMSVHKKMIDGSLSDEQKTKIAKEFVYENLFKNNNELYSSPEAIDDAVVEEFVKFKNVEESASFKMIQDLARIEFQSKEGSKGKFAQDARKGKKDRAHVEGVVKKFAERTDLQLAIQEGKLDPNFKENFKSLMNFSINNNNYLRYINKKTTTPARMVINRDGSLDFKNVYPTTKSFTQSTLNNILEKAIETQELKEFDSMMLMPNNEKINVTAKMNFTDNLIGYINQEMKTEEGKKNLLEMFEGNLYIENAIKNNTLPEIVEVMGYQQEKDGFARGKAPAKVYTSAQIGLIVDAIESGTDTYSQSVTVFSDKKNEVHIKNTKLLTLEEARKEIKKFEGSPVTFLNGDTYLSGDQNFINQLTKDLEIFVNNNNIEVSPNILEQVALNYAINKMHAKDLLLGPAKYFKNGRDYIKRSAGPIASGIKMGGRIEPIMIKDSVFYLNKEDESDIIFEEQYNKLSAKKKKQYDEVNRTDATSFILPEDGKDIKSLFGGVRQPGNHYKFVYNGQNFDNKQFENKFGKRLPFYGKTNVFVLSDNLIAQHPKFAELAQALRLRKKQGVVPIIMFNSAIKVQSNEMTESLVSVDELQELLKNEGKKLNEMQDDFFVDRENGLTGLDGNNFFLQTELDKSSSDAIFGKQFIAMLLSLPQNSKEAVGVVKKLMNARNSLNENKLSKFRPDNKDFREAVANVMDPKIFGEAVIEQVRSGSIDANTIEVINKTLKSQFQKSMKLRAPGGLLHQSTDFAIDTENISKDKISESPGLKGYVKEDGNIKEYAEVIVDESLGYQEGDIIILQRVPFSKLGDAVIGRVKGTVSNSGSMVMIPAELSHKIGSDMDGDSLHVVGEFKETKNKAQEEFNEAFNSVIDMLSKKEYQAYMEADMNFESAVEEAISKFPKGITPVNDNKNDLSILGNNDIYKSNVLGAGMIGIAAVLNTTQKTLSNFKVLGHPLQSTINNNEIQRSFEDGGSAFKNVAYILNIFLDNASKGKANQMNMNINTFNIIQQLVLRNVEFNNIMAILNHPATKRVSEIMSNLEGRPADNIQTAIEQASQELNVTSLDAYDIQINDSFVNQNAEVLTLLNEIYDVKQGAEQNYFGQGTSFLLTISTLNNLDSKMPENIHGARELKAKIDKLIKHISGTKGSAIFDASGLYKNGQFTSPVLQENYTKLTEYINDLTKLDPVHQSEFKSIATSEASTNKLKSLLLRMVGPELYQYNPANILGSVMSADVKVLEKLADANSKIQDINNIILENLSKVSLNNSQYEFFKFLSIEKVGPNYKIKLNRNIKENYELAQEAFEKLPPNMQDYLAHYDLVFNNHTGIDAILPYMGKSKKSKRFGIYKLGKKINLEKVATKQHLEKVKRFVENKTIASTSMSPFFIEKAREEVVVEENESGEVMYSRKVQPEVLGVAKGKQIIDQDGNFGSTAMYSYSEQIDSEESMPGLKGMIEYLRVAAGKSFESEQDAQARLEPKQYEAYKEMHKKYKEDFVKVSELEAKLISTDKNGNMKIESDAYTVDDLIKQMKELNTFDKTAKTRLYNTIGQVVGAKIALKVIQTQLNNAEKNGLSQEIIDKLEKEKQDIKLKKQGGDISKVTKWLSTDISDSIRGEIAELLNVLNQEEMLYGIEMDKVNNKFKMDKTYENLLKSKLGKGKSNLWFLKYGLYKLSYVARYYYNQRIFGNLMIEKQLEVPNIIERNGKKIQSGTKYKRILELKEVADDSFTPEELAYFNMYKQVTETFQKHLSQKIGQDGEVVLKEGRKNYIPHRSMSRNEMMIARNLTSAYILNNYSHELSKIVVVNRKTGESKPLRDFIEEYKILQIDKNTKRSIKLGSAQDRALRSEIKQLISDANRYLKRGTDADGNVIIREQAQDNEMGKYFNRYVEERSSSAEFSGTIDMHAALQDYVRTNLFYHGLDSQSGFKFKGITEQIPLIDGIMGYQSLRGRENARTWVKELLLERYVLKKTAKKSLFTASGERIWADKIFENLHKWTMFIGLGFNFTAGVGNILIGKYNTFRQAGWTKFRVGEARFFGMTKKGFDKNIANKTRKITTYFGLLNESSAQISEDIFRGPFGDLVFVAMVGSEKYIQRAQFAGMMTDAEFDSFEIVNGQVKVKPGQNTVEKNKTNKEVFDELSKNADRYKSKIFEVQGQGYTELDQRLIQHYSIVNGLLQFKRWLPTFILDRMSAEKQLRSGEWYIGTAPAMISYMKDVILDPDGKDVRGKFVTAFRKLPKHRQEAVARAYRGVLGMMTVVCLYAFTGGFSEDDDESAVQKQLKRTFWDMNLMLNIDKWQYMISMPAAQTGENLLFGMKDLVTRAEYQRDAKYGDKGDLKARGRLARLFPNIVRGAFAKE